MSSKKYRNVQLPSDVVDEIERVMENKKFLGYTSIAEFVKEAVRLRLEQVKRQVVLEERTVRR